MRRHCCRWPKQIVNGIGVSWLLLWRLARLCFGPEKLALTSAKFRAWWEGEEFDEAAALAAFEAKLAETPQAANGNVDDALFEPPPSICPPRLQALRLFWGADRLRPGDMTGEALEPARIGIAPDGLLAFLGPGHRRWRGRGASGQDRSLRMAR